MYSSSALFFFRFGESSLAQQVAMSVGAAVFATQTEETMGKPPFKTLYALARALQSYQEDPSGALWQDVEAAQLSMCDQWSAKHHNEPLSLRYRYCGLLSLVDFVRTVRGGRPVIERALEGFGAIYLVEQRIFQLLTEKFQLQFVPERE